MTDVTWLTQEAYDRLVEELADREGPRRAEITKRIQAAREEGDLKENGGYHAAKEEQGKMEARIRHLQGVLEDAEIVEVAASDVVVAGSVVTLTYEGDDDQERYLIGSIEERHDDLEVISPGSPLGSALLGSAVGDVVGFEAPNGSTLRVEVIDIA